MSRNCSGRIATVGKMVYLAIAYAVPFSFFCYASASVRLDRIAARNTQLQVYQNRYDQANRKSGYKKIQNLNSHKLFF